MKLSVSLPERDVQTLDEYAREQGLPSRSAVVQRAIALLRHPALERDYGAAWLEWESAGDEPDWDTAVGDGLTDASR